MTSQLTPLLASALTDDRLRYANIHRAAWPGRRRKSFLASLLRTGRRGRRPLASHTPPRFGI